MKQKKTFQSGFTLIETAIVMIILGVLTASLIQIYNTYRTNKIERENQQIFDSVHSALSAYGVAEEEYPCPANPALPPGDFNFGKQDCSIAPVGGVLIGALPVYERNLPFKMAADVYGGKYTYAVTEALTTALGAPGAIIIHDEGGNLFTADPVPFVIVSHGPDRKGARLLNGNAAPTACGATALDSENCNGNATFRDAEYASLDNVNNAAHYDDLISYSLARQETTLWTLSEEAGGAMNIYNRNVARVGIGGAPTFASAKLHVQGGNVIVQEDGSGNGGNILADGIIESEADIQAQGNITADGKVQSPRFYYKK